MRIIAGRLKGRRLRAPPGREVRPTSDRVRQALFGILEHGEPRLVGARFLDLFAGSGAVGLEAFSRGARRVLLMEREKPAIEAIRANLARLPTEGAVELRIADATQPGVADQPFEIAFLDPPYRSGLARAALEALARGGWLVPDARVVVELARTEDLEPPPGFALEQTRRYGAAKLVFLRFHPERRGGEPRGP